MQAEKLVYKATHKREQRWLSNYKDLQFNVAKFAWPNTLREWIHQAALRDAECWPQTHTVGSSSLPELQLFLVAPTRCMQSNSGASAVQTTTGRRCGTNQHWPQVRYNRPSNMKCKHGFYMENDKPKDRMSWTNWPRVPWQHNALIDTIVMRLTVITAARTKEQHDTATNTIYWTEQILR